METAKAIVSFPIELLPFEAIKVVARHLSIKDLAACCATSHRMRDLFNENILWKPHCNKALEEYLRTTPCKVEPSFVSPEVEYSTLGPISMWRLAFMRENHLWNNWRQGTFKQEEIRNQHSDYSMYETICHIFLNNDCIIALFKNRIELLDVREFPARNAAETICCSCFKIINAKNDRIVTMYKHCGVQVYHVNLSTGQCSLIHAFWFVASQKVAIERPIPDQVIKSIFDVEKPRRCAVCEVVGHFFVGISDEGLLTMHIWDLDTGLKVKEELCPIKRKVVQFKASDTTMKLVFLFRNDEDNSNIFLAYDLTKLVYLPFNEMLQGSCQYSVLHSYVAILNNGMLHIYNYLTSEVILKDQQAVGCSDTSVQIFRNHFLFIDKGWLKTFNPYTCVINVLWSSNGEVTWFEVLSDKFIQVKKCRQLKIWEMKGLLNPIKKTSMNLRFNACRFFLNGSSTRYIVRYNVGSVLHFW